MSDTEPVTQTVTQAAARVSAATGSPGGPTARIAVEREVIALVRRSRASANAAARRVDPRLDGSAYAALIRLDDAGPQRATTLAGFLSLDKSTVSRLLAGLAELGLVERQPDPTDRRAHLVRLTDEGARRLASVRATRRAALHQAFEGWPEDDLERFAALLAAFNRSEEPALAAEPATPASVPPGEE